MSKEVTTKTNMVVVKVVKTLRVILVLVLMLGLTYGLSKLSVQITGKKTVEQYCSVAYQHDVEQYKTCKELNTVQLIDKLKEEASKKYEVPDLNALKF